MVTRFVASPTQLTSTEKGLFEGGSGHRDVAQISTAFQKMPRALLAFPWIVRLRCQLLNLAPPKRVRAWGEGTLRLEESRSLHAWHECRFPSIYDRHDKVTRTESCTEKHGRRLTRIGAAWLHASVWCWLPATLLSLFMHTQMYATWTYVHSTCGCMQICILMGQRYCRVKSSRSNVVRDHTDPMSL